MDNIWVSPFSSCYSKLEMTLLIPNISSKYRSIPNKCYIYWLLKDKINRPPIFTVKFKLLVRCLKWMQIQGKKRLLEILGMSKWLLLNANSAICHLYHGEYKLIFNDACLWSKRWLLKDKINRPPIFTVKFKLLVRCLKWMQIQGKKRFNTKSDMINHIRNLGCQIKLQNLHYMAFEVIVA
jgi:hypothetical protein